MLLPVCFNATILSPRQSLYFSDDKIITKREFDHVWTTLNLPEKTNVAADFELIDTNHDAQLSEEDLTYLCKLFDENGGFYTSNN